MKILILGAGAIGGYVGARLSQAGADVTFLVRERRRSQLLADGLRIESPLGDARLPVATVTSGTVTPVHDLVLLTCKAYDLEEAINAAASGLAPAGRVLPLLNGMSHMELLDARFGAARVLGGLITIAVTLRGDGVVHHLNNVCSLSFGDRSGATDGPVADIAALLRKAEGMSARAVPDITRQMWQKLVMLGTLACTGCLLRGSVAEINSSAEGATVFQRVLANAIETATKLGYPPDARSVEVAQGIVSDQTSSMTASMLRDLESGQRVEADHIAGYLLASARAAGVDDTLFSAAYAALKTYEARREAGRLPAPC